MQPLLLDLTRKEMMQGKLGEDEDEEEEEEKEGGHDDAEEADFDEEAQAFVRKSHVHEMAIRTLMQDLLEESDDDEENGEEEDDEELDENEALNGMKAFLEKQKAMVNGTMEEEDSKGEENYEREVFKSKNVFLKKQKTLSNEALKDGEENKTLRSVEGSINKTVKMKKTRYLLDVERAGKITKIFSYQQGKSTTNHGSRQYLKIRNEDNTSKCEHDINHFFCKKSNPALGPFFLNLVKRSLSSNKPKKALYFAYQALNLLETSSYRKPNLDIMMCLHVISSIQSALGHYEEAVNTLQGSVDIINVEKTGEEHALAFFACYMQLGDTFALLGNDKESLSAYQFAFDIQIGTIGKIDRRVGETCRYLAEAYAKALQFDKAEEFCQYALEIDRECNAPLSFEEFGDRRLMGLICNAKGDHEAALEHLLLANMALMANNKKNDVEMAVVNNSIGDTYVSLGKLDEAIVAYLKALRIFNASKGNKYLVAVAGIYVSLADLHLKRGKRHEARSYCESAMTIYNKIRCRNQAKEVACGLSGMAIVYEGLKEHNEALRLLQKALEVVGGDSCGNEAQIGVLHYMHGDFVEALSCYDKVVIQMRNGVEKRSSLFGIVLNQMGLVHVQLSNIQLAIELFLASGDVLERNLGRHHPDTLMVYGNLSSLMMPSEV